MNIENALRGLLEDQQKSKSFQLSKLYRTIDEGHEVIEAIKEIGRQMRVQQDRLERMLIEDEQRRVESAQAEIRKLSRLEDDEPDRFDTEIKKRTPAKSFLEPEENESDIVPNFLVDITETQNEKH